MIIRQTKGMKTGIIKIDVLVAGPSLSGISVGCFATNAHWHRCQKSSIRRTCCNMGFSDSLSTHNRRDGVDGEESMR